MNPITEPVRAEHIADLRRRLMNARKRARYWSGTPSFGSNRYVPRRARHNRDLEYEMALDDQHSLRALLLDLGDTPPRFIDYHAEFVARFLAAQAKRK